MKEIVLLTGAGRIGLAIVRRVAAGKRIFVGDRRLENARATARELTEAGYDAVPCEVDIASRASIRAMIAAARQEGEIAMLINAAGVSPSQAPVETILRVAELLIGEQGSFITGADFLIDGGATASYFYGPLRPQA